MRMKFSRKNASDKRRQQERDKDAYYELQHFTKKYRLGHPSLA